MTINRNLYIITEQVEQQTEHKSSVFHVGENPRLTVKQVIKSVEKGRITNVSSLLVHRVKLNNMGAKDVQVIDYSELISDAQSFRELDSSKDSEETRI